METDTQHPLAEYGKEGANVHVRLRDVKMNVRAWMGGVDFFNASSSVRRRGRGWKKFRGGGGDDTAEENPLLNQGVEERGGRGSCRKKLMSAARAGGVTYVKYYAPKCSSSNHGFSQKIALGEKRNFSSVTSFWARWGKK